MTDPKSEPSEGCAVNTDREVWSAGYDYRDERVFITQGNGIGIEVGGYCIVKPAAEWHRLAALTPAPAQPEPPTAAGVEPVAEVNRAGSLVWATHCSIEELRARHPELQIGSKLYTTPPTLTDAQCDAIYEAISVYSDPADDRIRALIRNAAG